MASLPYSGVPTTTPDVRQPDSYQKVDAGPASFGGSIATGLEQFGQGASKAGKFWGQIQTDDAVNNAMEGMNGVLDKFRSLRGQDALNAQQDTYKQAKDIMDQNKAGLSAEQQLQYDNLTRSFHQRYFSGIVASHADQQGKEFTTATNNAKIQVAMTGAANVAEDDAQVDMFAHMAGEGAVKNVIADGNASDFQTVKAARDRAVAATYKTAAEVRAVRNPDGALDYINKHRDQLGELYAPLAEKFRTQAADTKGQNFVRQQMGEPLSTSSRPSGVVNQGIPPEGRALLDTIAGPESGASGYNARYPGGTFDNGFADHPRIRSVISNGPDAGRTSDAAGRYQFLSSTWDAEARKLGLKSFSPANQDAAAWDLAQTTYQEKTGRDLSADLRSGDPKTIAGVSSALRGQWASLPGGHQPGTTTDRFVTSISTGLGGMAQPTNAYFVGDSIADGLRTAAKGQGVTEVGASPDKVLDQINKLDPANIAGKPFVLSSGISNDVTKIDVVPQQIAALVAKGVNPANITIVGVGNRADFQSNAINAKLAAIARETGARFTGPLDPRNLASDGVHPSNYQTVLGGLRPSQSSPPPGQVASDTSIVNAGTVTPISTDGNPDLTGGVTPVVSPSPPAIITGAPAAKADLYQKIHEAEQNGALDPESAKAAYREAGFQVQRQQIEEASTQTALKDAAEQRADWYGKQTLGGTATAKTFDQLLNDPAFNHFPALRQELGKAMLANVDEGVVAAAKHYGSGYWDAKRRILLPAGDPKRISDVADIYREAGIRDDGTPGTLTMSGADKLVSMMQGVRKSVETSSVQHALTRWIDYAKPDISFDGEMSVPGLPPKVDPEGKKLFDQFAADLELGLDKAVAKGEDPHKYLSKENIDKVMAPYLRSKAQMKMDRIAAQPDQAEQPGTPLPVAPQGVDRGGWTGLMKTIPMHEDGTPFSHAKWGAALERLARDKDVTAWNKSAFGQAGWDGNEILQSMFPAVRKEVLDTGGAVTGTAAVTSTAPATGEPAPKAPPVAAAPPAHPSFEQQQDKLAKDISDWYAKQPHKFETTPNIKPFGHVEAPDIGYAAVDLIKKLFASKDAPADLKAAIAKQLGHRAPGSIEGQ